MKSRTSWLYASLVILSLSACGQKGPLYLPDTVSDKNNKQEQSHESKIYKNARAGQ